MEHIKQKTFEGLKATSDYNIGVKNFQNRKNYSTLNFPNTINGGVSFSNEVTQPNPEFITLDKKKLKTLLKIFKTTKSKKLTLAVKTGKPLLAQLYDSNGDKNGKVIIAPENDFSDIDYEDRVKLFYEGSTNISIEHNRNFPVYTALRNLDDDQEISKPDFIDYLKEHSDLQEDTITEKLDYFIGTYDDFEVNDNNEIRKT